jgi:hypothetical protein
VVAQIQVLLTWRNFGVFGILHEQTRIIDLVTGCMLREPSLYQLSNADIVYLHFGLMWLNNEFCGLGEIPPFSGYLLKATRYFDSVTRRVLRRGSHYQHSNTSMYDPLFSTIWIQPWVLEIEMGLDTTILKRGAHFREFLFDDFHLNVS